jgi:hypothetical protein
MHDRNLGGYEDGLRPDRYGTMERALKVAKQLPAGHVPGILKLQDLLDNNGKCRKLKQH